MRGFYLAVLGLAALGAAGARAQETTSPRIQTTPEANSENLEGVAKAPLRDLNVVRTKIPPMLLDSMADPYKRPPNTSCQELAMLLAPLNEALGADLDAPSIDEDDLLQKGQKTALGVAAGVASSAIPFRGWVRKLSGAERHDATVQAAITAGAVRRAYLKGLGEARGCSPPATPSHEITAAKVERDQARAAGEGLPPPSDGLFKPRFPVR